MTYKAVKRVSRKTGGSLIVVAFLTVFLAGFASAPAQSQDANQTRTPAASLEDILKRLALYDYGQSESVLADLRDYVLSHKDPASSREECEVQFQAFLEGEATAAGKLAACRWLRRIGTEKSVPGLGVMLLEAETSDMARYALEKIPGDAAAKALMDALSNARGPKKIGLISSLGERRAGEATPLLGRLLQGRDENEAAAAATALGKIGGSEASAFLSASLDRARGELKSRVTSALLLGAENFASEKKYPQATAIYDRVLTSRPSLVAKQAALKGKIGVAGTSGAKIILSALESRDSETHPPAIAMIKAGFDADSIGPVLKLLPKLPEQSQVQLLNVLADYPKEIVLGTILKTAESPRPEVRIASIRALGKIGDASVVSFLAGRAAQSAGKERIAARESLSNLKGAEADRAVLQGLEGSQNQGIRNELVLAVKDRGIHEGKDLLIKLLESPSASTRIQAAKALKEIATLADLRFLITVMLRMEDESEISEMQSTVAALALKIVRPYARADAVAAAMASEAEPKKRGTLIGVLGKIGDDSSLPAVRKALEDPDPVVVEAAVRALAMWPTISARDDVLSIAKNSQNLNHKVLSLRAYVRMIGLEPYRSPRGATVSLKEALRLAERPEEKKLVLGALPDFACEEALTVAESLLATEEVRAEAQAAVEKISEKLKKK
jgi:HEAT repeat protein